ncbi:MAG: transglutaminase domain-containing protein [Candidatus Aenigmatarchaeota archaeon]
MRKILFILALALFLPLSCHAEALNPPLVSHMEAEVVQKGSVELTGPADMLIINMTIPQEDQYQKVRIDYASSDYKIVKDSLGNSLLTMTFINPGSRAEYEVRSTVTVDRRLSASVPEAKEFRLPSALIQSDDPRIIGLAENITVGQTSAFAKVALVSKWVHENIKYDLSPKYADANLSALATLDNKAGVCDEFSSLVIAAGRSIGYPSAYSVGYAYGRGYRIAEDFVPHGWAEVCTPEGCWPSDSTWAETGFVDATHIKFATLVDSYFPEVTATARGATSIKVNPTEIRITILNFKEEPLIRTENTLLKDRLWNGYAVMRTDMSTSGCVLTNVVSKSCVNEGREFFQALEPEKIVYFCGSKSVYSIYKLPESLNRNIRYTCELISYPYAGEDKRQSVVLDSKEGAGEKVSLAVDKTTLVPGEKFTALSPGAWLFTDYGREALDRAEWYAPSEDFRVYAYSKGSLAAQDMRVVISKPFELAVSADRQNITLGGNATLTAEVRNLLGSEQVIRLSVSGRERTLTVPAGATDSAEFVFIPQSVDDNVAQVVASSSSFSTSSSVRFNVAEEKGVFGFLEGIFAAIAKFFEGFFG